MKTLTLDKEAMAISQSYAALHAKCPKCRVGNMFATPMYTLSGQKMNQYCPHCNFHFEIEPGYFYVAMFVSYALNVAEMVTLAVGTYILTHSENPWIYLTILLGVAFILSPFNFRYARVALLYWLTPGVHYDPKRSAPDYDPNHPEGIRSKTNALIPLLRGVRGVCAVGFVAETHPSHYTSFRAPSQEGK